MLTISSGVLTGLLVIFQAYELSGIINDVHLAGKDLAAVMPRLWRLLAIILIRVGTGFAGDLFAAALAVQVKQRLRQLLLRKWIDLGPAYSSGEQSGELATAAFEGIEALDAYFSQYLPQLVLAALIPLAVLFFVFPLDLVSGLVLLFTAPLIPLFMILIGKAAEALTRRQWLALSRMSAFFLDTLKGLATLKALNRSLEQGEKIAAVSEQYRRATMAVLRVTFLSALALELAATLSTAVVAVQIGLRLLYGWLDFREAFFVLVIAPEFYLPLRMLGMRFHAGMSGSAAARRIFEILDQPAVIRETFAADQQKTALQENRLFEPPFILAFEKVGFTYPGRNLAALDEVDFQIYAGQKVALVGSSGAGKSTLAQLVLRFIRPTQGQITLNGGSIESFGEEAWRGQIAWLPQRPYLFNDTISANLRIGKDDASEDELRGAARQALLDDFIRCLPDGYQTCIGEGGARLSDGEAQRLALGRAFLKDAPFLILDEPTVHLDPRSEALFQEAFRRLAVGKTVLLIAHRLHTVMDADHILILDHGRVIEQGHPQALLKEGRIFSRLTAGYGGLA